MTMDFILGVDVSKKTLSVVLVDQKDKTIWSCKNMPNDDVGFQKLLDSIIQVASKKAGAEDYTIKAGLESTGVYGERLLNFLHGNNTGGRISVYELNPLAVKSFRQALMKQNKNDAADAKTIASYIPTAIARGQISPWNMLDHERKVLQELSRRRDELKELICEEKNRLEKIENAHAPSEQVKESLMGHLGYLNSGLQQIEKDIEDHIESDERLKSDIELLRSIPGIGTVNAVKFVCEIGDVKAFSSVKRLVSIIGIAPTEHTSGTSVHGRTRISRQGKTRVRNGLYMAALVASHANPIIKNFYDKLLKKGKCKKVALVACIRKLVHIIWGILKSRKTFDASYGQN